MNAGGSQDSMGPAFEVVASLGAAATACLLPGTSGMSLAAHSVPGSCFDSLACGEGSGPWVAVRTAPCAVQVLQGAVPHVAVVLPEPVAAVQLGLTAAARASAAGRQPAGGCSDGDEAAATVLVVVGESCRVWAWRLHQAAAAGGSAAARGQRHRGDAFCPGPAEEEEGSGDGSSRRGKRKLGLSGSTREGAAVQPGHSGADTAASSAQQAIPLALEGDSSSWGMPPWLAAATPPAVLEVQSAPLQPPPTSTTSSSGGNDGSGSAVCMAAVAELAGAPKLGSVESHAARAQLAAQVAWEYLDALVRQEGCRDLGRCEGPTSSAQPSALAVPISLSKAGGAQAPNASTAAGAAPAAVVHSMATWAASHDLPADASCACFLALPPALPTHCPEFRGNTRLGWRADGTQQQQQCAAAEGRSGKVAAGEGGGPPDAMEWEAAPTSSTLAAGQPALGRPLGYLLVGTASGDVSAFPVGTPVGSSFRGAGVGHGSLAAISGSGSAGAAVGWLGGQRPLAVVHGTRLQLIWLPGGQQAASGGPSAAAAAGIGSWEPLRLVLHAASGTVAPSPPDPCRAVVLAGGSMTEREAAAVDDSGAGGEGQQGGIVAAVMRVSGDVDSVCVQGGMLFYTARGKLRCLDCTSLQQLLGSASPDDAGGSPQAVHIPAPVPIHLISTPAAPEQPFPGSDGSASGQELLLLSARGLLLRMACPAGTSWLHPMASRREAVPLAELEQEMQELLGDVAELSASQEAATAAQAQLDSQLGDLSSAIPAVQSINCGTAAGLYCSVRPLYRLAAVVGGGEEAGFAVEVSLHNGGLWELPAGHSLFVALSGAPAPGSDRGWAASSGTDNQEAGEGYQSISHSVPLPRLPPGTSNTCTCFLAAPTSSSGRWQAGVLRVLLCHHGAAGEAHAALLHTVRLDLLHFYQPGPSLARTASAPGHQGFPALGQGSLGRAARHQHMQLPASGQAVAAGTAEVQLRLQLPCWLFGRRPDAGAALAALLDQGLSSLDLSPAPAATDRGTGMAGGSCSRGLAGVRASAGGGQGLAGGPAALAGGTGSWDKAAQQERVARQERQRQLFATQLGPSAAQALPLAAASAGTAGSAGYQGPGGIPGSEGTAWWEPWLQQQRQQQQLPPAAAFSLLPAVPGGAVLSGPSGPSMLFSTAGGAAGQAAGTHPAQPAVVHADFPNSQAVGGSTTSVEISARLLPRRGPQAGASWQHAELHVTTRSAGVSVVLGAHAALVQRVMAMQSSMPEQDPPFGLRLGGSSTGIAGAPASALASSLGALLVPQDAMSALEAAVEGADEAELERALCALRQLKSRALALRDEALGLAQQARQAQQVQHAEGDSGGMLAGQAVGRAGVVPQKQELPVGRRSSSGPAGARAEERQAQGVQLQRDLQELALGLRQQAGSVPVIMT